MSSSSFSFSSSEDEAALLRGATASEGRMIVVADTASRALPNPSIGDHGAAVERDGDDDMKYGNKKKRKSSERKRRRKGDRRRKRSGSCSPGGSEASPDGDEKRRRKHRKDHKSKRDRKRESNSDRKKRRRKNYRGSRSRSRSRSRGRSSDDASSRPDRKKEEGSEDASPTSKIRLPRPSTGRSFASVSKSVGEVRPPSPKLLMIEDGKAKDDGTRGQQQPIEAKQDFRVIEVIQAYKEARLFHCRTATEKERQSLLFPIDYEAYIEDESDLNKLYLDKQRRLNEMVRTNPTDTEAWVALANLHQPVPKASDSNEKETTGAKYESKDIARLERKREILTRGVKNNLECIELRVALIETLECLSLLSATSKAEIEAESDAAIRMFEVLVAEESKSCLQGEQVRPIKMGALVALHRMRLRRYQRRKECTANNLRDSFIEAFASVSKACRATESIAPPPAEMSVLFLDYLRAEALLGYSERAVALIQAALEINLHRHSGNDGKAVTSNNSWESSFFDYWNSESNRIGDAYPHSGWLQYEKAKDINSDEKKMPSTAGRKKAKKRLRASDFFAESSKADSASNDAPNVQEIMPEITKGGDKASIDRAQSLASAYTSASSATQSNEGSLPSNTQESAQVVGHILGAAKSAVEKQEERKKRREKEELEIFGKNGESVASEAAVFAADGTDIAVSDVKHPKPTHAYVYSFILNRRIEVSLDELRGSATKDSLRATLAHLRARKKKHEANKSSYVTNKSAEDKLYIIQDDDTFLRWAMEEAKTQDFIFSLPRKSSRDEIERAEFYDPNERVWIEDGIQWIVTPYLSHLPDEYGVPTLVSVCLQFLGVTFPRSLLGDTFEMNRYVMGTTSGGGERLEQSVLSDTFDGVLKPSSGERKLSPQSDLHLIYRQLLFDDTTVVAFDERIFHANHEMQKKFMRNCLYTIATSTNAQMGYNELEPSWRSYVQIALIAFEARASGEKAVEVAQRILAGTKEAKCDPRLIMAYALLDFNLLLSRDPNDSSKAFKSARKILLRAMEAGGSDIFQSLYRTWWFELALMAVRSMLKLPIGAASAKSSNFAFLLESICLSREERDRILHVICCAIEGLYQPLPKERSQKKDKNIPSAALVDEARIRTCMLTIRTKLVSCNENHVDFTTFSHHQSAEAFDRTPTMCYFAILSSWLAALDPKKCKHGGIDFTAGFSLLDDFAFIRAPRREGDEASFQTYMLRIAHAKLELSILQFHESEKRRSLQVPFSFTSCLVSCVAQLKCLGIAPSKSLMQAMAHLEKQHSQRVRGGYSDLLVPDLDVGGIHPNEILFLLEKAVAAADKTINDPTLLQTTPMARCSFWTKDGRKTVEEALLTVISRSTYCCYPSLYSALLQLSLLGSVQSKRPSRAFHKTKDLYHNTILPSSSFSKSLWLDAFTLLRPTYSDVEMVYHMAAMEEKDIRLRKGLEGVMRIAGAKTTGD